MFNNATMYGTSGATFTLVLVAAQARIGFRDLGSSFRVRVEVEPGVTLPLSGKWKTPEASQSRYSIVVPAANLNAAILDAVRAILGVPLKVHTITESIPVTTYETKTETVSVTPTVG